MRFQYDDGGRKAAGFRGETGDCVTRAIAIALERPYRDVYDAINDASYQERWVRSRKVKFAQATGRGSSARTGVLKPTTRRIMEAEGLRWVAMMGIGTGCRCHLRDGELPMGRLIVSVSGHLVAVIDGVIHDTHDPSRGGMRCVYGYWVAA